MTHRVQCPPISAELEMHVIAGRMAGPADRGDYIPLLHALTLLHHVALIVRVRSFNAVAVIDDNHVTIAAIIPGELDPARGRRANRCSAGRAQINTGMQASPAATEMRRDFKLSQRPDKIGAPQLIVYLRIRLIRFLPDFAGRIMVVR